MKKYECLSSSHYASEFRPGTMKAEALGMHLAAMDHGSKQKRIVPDIPQSLSPSQHDGPHSTAATTSQRNLVLCHSLFDLRPEAQPPPNLLGDPIMVGEHGGAAEPGDQPTALPKQNPQLPLPAPHAGREFTIACTVSLTMTRRSRPRAPTDSVAHGLACPPHV